MAVKTEAQLETERDTFTDGGSNTASKFRTFLGNIIDTMFNGVPASTDISGLTALTDLDADDDQLIVYDDSAGANKKFVVKHLPFGNFTGLTLSNIDASQDFLVIWDDSASEVKNLDVTYIHYNGGNTGSYLKTITKTVQIGDWNMDSTGSVTLTTGIPSFTSIRSVSCVIRDDLNVQTKSLFSDNSASGTTDGYWIAAVGGLTLYRTASGAFDSTSFDSTSYNRGWVTITYEE